MLVKQKVNFFSPCLMCLTLLLLTGHGRYFVLLNYHTRFV